MMTEDLSGDCLNISTRWRFLHRRLFHRLQAPHSLQCIYSPNRGGYYLNMWSLGVSVGRKIALAERDSNPPQPSKPWALCLQTWFLWCCCLSWAQMGALVWPCAHTRPSLHSQHWQCAVPPLTQRGRAWSSRDRDSGPSASGTANIDQPLCQESLLIYPKPVHPPWKIRADKETFTEFKRMPVGAKAW